jgi:hypothetical protein
MEMIGRSKRRARSQLVAVGPVAGLVEDFAQHAGRMEAGHAGQVDGRFGVAGAAEYTALLGHERLDVAGAGEVGRLARGVAEGLDRAGPFGGGDAGLDRTMVDRHCVIGAERGRVLADHQRQFKPLAGLGQERHAELAAAVSDHEVDDFGRDPLGGGDEIALVFAVLVVDHDDHAALADGLDGFFDRGKTAGHAEHFGVKDASHIFKLVTAGGAFYYRCVRAGTNWGTRMLHTGARHTGH